MTSWILALAACVVVVRAGEEGGLNEGRKALCEKEDSNMYQELDACFQNEAPLVIKATESCVKKILPGSNGSGTELFLAACKDHPLFVKYDECYGEHRTDEEFKKLERISAEVAACYDEVMTKYDLQ